MLKRILSLACCLSLTVGLFTYRPPEAKAIAIADDAIVTAVILSVLAYGGYKLWVDNLDASAIADIIKPHVKQWNYEHGSSAEDPFSGFAEWATGGMDKFRKSITPVPGGPGPDMNGISWVLSFALFDKVCQFAEWLGNRVGVKPGVAEPVPIAPSVGYTCQLLDGSTFKLGYPLGNGYYSPGDIFLEIPKTLEEMNSLIGKTFYFKFFDDVYFEYSFKKTSDNMWCVAFNFRYGSQSEKGTLNVAKPYEDKPYKLISDCLSLGVNPGEDGLLILSHSVWDRSSSGYLKWDWWLRTHLLNLERIQGRDIPSATLALPGTWSPTVPAEGTETVPMVIPGATPAGVLDVDALVQEILNRVTKNELIVQPSGSPAPDPGVQPDTKPSINPGTDTEGLGLFGWLKRIWESIIALPAQIAEAIKNIFIPHEGYAAEFVADLAGAYQGRFGLLTYPVAVLADFVGTVATLDEQEPILRWNDVKWQGQVVIAKGEYNLKSAIAGTEMQTVYQVYRVVASAALIVGFIHLCIRKLREVQSN